MTEKAAGKKLGVHDIVVGIHDSLQQYIEAQYHIRNEMLVAERTALLSQRGVIAQHAFVEATPVYAYGNRYADLNIPDPAKRALTDIAGMGGNVGLYPTPYKHQTEALEAFLGPESADLVVATGTGSGKTESFLMPIVGALAIEGVERRKTADLHGCRAILLYPMNALVNDQVSRIRRLLGNEQANAILSGGRARPIRFGSYTGRTPYPGKRTPQKDKANIAPLFDEFYTKVSKNSTLLSQLMQMGRWPSKNLEGFYNASAIEIGTYGSGKKAGQQRVSWNWPNRLKTQDGDRELMTRHEMQTSCPDILVTNYSMLEYMLMRPIESPIFDKTAAWLSSDLRNELILVLDEAHMYRGAGGAEVALLIRRLVARLGISRDRVRCILTSASIGTDGPETIANAKQFADDLTGRTQKSVRHFRIVTGTREERPPGTAATDIETKALASVDASQVSNGTLELDPAVEEIETLGEKLGWPPMDGSSADLPDYLFKRLTGFGPMELLITSVMGSAISLEDLRQTICPGTLSNEAKKALDTLLALGSFARRRSDGRILMPTRLHLFHRGLPGLYACVDQNCTARLSQPTTATILGRFHTKSLLSCFCTSHGRVYEYYTHRDCGASFIRGWIDSTLNFVWHEPDALSLEDRSRRLFPIDILVEASCNPSARTREMWLQTTTGQLLKNRPADITGFRGVRVPDRDAHAEQDMTFEHCPVCGKRAAMQKGDSSKIMDHVTKGEAPFSQLVRAQMVYQPATKQTSRQYPNGGRKVLVFSDGRQKAARLARDMPRDMELDVFRQAVAVACGLLKDAGSGREARPTDTLLYPAFIAALSKHNLSIFDVESEQIDSHVKTFEKDFDDLYEALAAPWDPGTPPLRYKVALLKLLCSSYYSLAGTTVGFVSPSSLALKHLNRAETSPVLNALFPTSEERIAVAVAWISELLSEFAFDKDINDSTRGKAAGYYGATWGSKGKFEKNFRISLSRDFGLDEETIGRVEAELKSALTSGDGACYLKPDSLKLVIDLDHHWFHCSECTALMALSLRGRCLSCGSDKIKGLDPSTDTYLVARKSFWRSPVAYALEPGGKLSNLYAEEHTAQLSNRDRKSVHATTELHELRFQDVLIDPNERPIDVLSCTTTMEVGIDIGSLVAVALRNIPPQRENYQQRAGRAGRRGSAVSSVVSYSQNGPHDSYYFLNPRHIVSGAPRKPELKIDNPKIATRHVHAFLMQTFFQTSPATQTRVLTSAILQRALGRTREFFHSNDTDGLNLMAFESWVRENVLSDPFALRNLIADWLPENLDVGTGSLRDWVSNVASDFIKNLQKHKNDVPLPLEGDGSAQIDDDADDMDGQPALEQEELLEFLFFHSLLPTYAFPTSLCSFLVEKFVQNSKGFWEIRVDQMPQQSTNQALSEYAPGRLVVINKKTYRSGGVFANTASSVVDRAETLFAKQKVLVMCDVCSYVRDPDSSNKSSDDCPVCKSRLSKSLVIQPEVFGPEKAKALAEDDREQEITYATMAQFPQPVGGESFDFKEAGKNLKVTYATDNRLLTLNKGAIRKDEPLGFSVCRKCGCAEVYNEGKPKSGPHARPYKLKHGPNNASGECDGDFERVFLWYNFRTDLLLLRISIGKPLANDLMSQQVVRTLESAASTIAEALRLAASRHDQLDLDPAEFGAGHRLLPMTEDGKILLDVYLYDTLSGGAGHSELAARYFGDIAKSTLKLLEGCTCDTSCTDCLDHFHNQHLKKKLDRKLASSLLRYALYGTVPEAPDTCVQSRQLAPLAAMLRLDGFECELDGPSSGETVVSLMVTKGARSLSIRLFPTLLAEPPLIMAASNSSSVHHVREATLRSDLPGVHAAIRGIFV